MTGDGQTASAGERLGFFDQHHRNPVADGITKLAARAIQGLPFLRALELLVALRTNQNFGQLLAYGHVALLMNVKCRRFLSKRRLVRL